ncbi:hypothetical protein L484_018105 [Morus notabilis]|uniref:Uncharacterized protein n=1 Tax=Morus notabilis TaxID=981085 RepID=W9R3B2_9ROSA|nr:hypothetical protein L484_018105 [Morus notabilis]
MVLVSRVLPKLHPTWLKYWSHPQQQHKPDIFTTIIDLESQQQVNNITSITTTNISSSSLSHHAYAAQSLHQNRDARHVIMAFCFTSVLEIALQSSSQSQPAAAAARVHHLSQLIFDLLSVAILLTFSALFISNYINSRFHIAAAFLEQVAIFFSVTAFFVAVSIHFPVCLKCVNWAIYAVSLFIVWFSNKNDGVFFSRS